MKTVQFKGYTILELLIVVAVSSFMFVVVSISFGGRQEQVQFTQAVRDFDSQLKDIINDVSTGYFPESAEGCTVSGGNGPNRRPVLSASPGDIGTNDECVLIGKAIQFSPEVNNGVNDNRELYKVYNIVGLRVNSDNVNPTSLAESVPRVVPTPEDNQLRWGLRVTRIISSNPTRNNLGGIAIYSSLDRSSSLLSSSTNESVQIGAIQGTSFDTSESAFETDIENQNINQFNSTSTSNTIICLSNPSGEKVAYISFGGNQQVGTIIEFEEVGICA